MYSRLYQIALIVMFFGLAVLFHYIIPARPVGATDSSNLWIPLEDRDTIRRMQFPEQFPPELLLPDLRTLPPTDLLLQIVRGQGITRIRFTNTIWNTGPGNLEMRAAPFPLPGAVQVSQVIRRDDGVTVLRDAGLFDFHDTHGHWHWTGFSIYQVWSITPNGTLNELVASSDKIGYCLVDMAPYPGDDAPPFPEGIVPPAQAQYVGCVWTHQGISAGWIDSYKSQIDGQQVDITGLPNGVYALQSIVDPDNIIQEGDENNNGAVMYFRLDGERLIMLGSVFQASSFEQIQTPK